MFDVYGSVEYMGKQPNVQIRVKSLLATEMKEKNMRLSSNLSVLMMGNLSGRIFIFGWYQRSGEKSLSYIYLMTN